MKPTIGRIVLFRVDKNTQFPAIITRVWAPEFTEAVNLQVFKDHIVESFTSVFKGEGAGQWDWMPFQKDQQIKAGAMANLVIEKRTGGASLLGGAPIA